MCVCVLLKNERIFNSQKNLKRCYNSFQSSRADKEWILSLGWKNKLNPTSLAVTEGILVSFYYAAPTDMFKFSAYPCSSWCAVFFFLDVFQQLDREKKKKTREHCFGFLLRWSLSFKKKKNQWHINANKALWYAEVFFFENGKISKQKKNENNSFLFFFLSLCYLSLF